MDALFAFIICNLLVDLEQFQGSGVANATGLGKKPYIARKVLRYVLPLSSDTQTVQRVQDTLPGKEAVQHIEFKIGTLAASDDFDKNRYANSTREIGVFARLGWNDGKTESFAFTEVDHLVSVGAQLDGVHWRRSADRVGLAYVIGNLSGDHEHYLADGGEGFVVGDGHIRYGAEQVPEAYYRLQPIHHRHSDSVATDAIVEYKTVLDTKDASRR
jgi:carbohydrate-selective porin OprB